MNLSEFDSQFLHNYTFHKALLHLFGIGFLNTGLQLFLEARSCTLELPSKLH